MGGLLCGASLHPVLGQAGPEDPDSDHGPAYPVCGPRSKARPTNWTGTVSPSQSPCFWDVDRKEEGLGGARSLPAGGALWLPGARPSSWADLAPLGSPAINSCAVGNGGCQHNCVQLTVTQHRCRCRPEFQLQEDGKRCVRECHQRREGEGQGWDSHWDPRSARTHRPARETHSLSPSLPCCWCWRGASGTAGAPSAAERLWGIVQPLQAPGRKPVRLCSGVTHLRGAGSSGRGYGGEKEGHPACPPVLRPTLGLAWARGTPALALGGCPGPV